MKKRLALLLLLMLSVIPVFSQSDPLDYEALTIPSLDELFAGARRNPTVALYSLQKEAEELQLKTEKRLWLRFIKVSASAQYGVMSLSTYNNPGIDLPVIYQTSGTAQLWYNFGVSLTIPFDDLFDRNNRVKKQQIKIEETEMEIERWFDDQKLKIIDAYTTAQMRLAIIKYKAEAASLATAQYNISEKEFIMGKIESYVLNNHKSVQTRAFTELEEARTALNNSLLRLEVLCNMKIINK